MRLVPDQCTLVLAGSWNAAILQPNWIAKEILGYERDRQFQISVQMPMLGGPSLTPRFTFDQVSVAVHPSFITLFADPRDAAKSALALRVATGILRKLVHTPVTAVGFNFIFASTQPSEPLNAYFPGVARLPAFVEDEAAEVVNQTLTSTIKVTDHLLSVSATPKADGFDLSVNCHFEVSDAAAAARVTERELIYASLLAEARGVAQGMTAQVLEEQ